MPGFLDKPLNQVTAVDVQRICDEKMLEAADLEFKSQIPAKKNTKQSPADSSEIDDHAINKLLAEIIAFANSHGGMLIVGIDETNDSPARAEKISALQNCAELAERLRLICRDCIEPKLPMIEIEGIVTDSASSGVVICTVSASRLAPHRHTRTLHCYVRRNDRSEKMTMREIQDLTLFVERGTKTIEESFNGRAKKFESRVGSPPDTVFLRVTVIPLTPIFIKRVHARGDLRPSLLKFKSLKDAETVALQKLASNSLTWYPMIGGTRSSLESDHKRIDVEMYDSGLLEYLFRIETPGQARGWFRLIPVVEAICSALISADRFRNGAGAPNAEVGLEVAVIVNQNPMQVVPAGHNGYDAFGRLGRGLHALPRYSLGDIAELPLILNEVIRDIANAAGVDFPSNMNIELIQND